MSKSVWRSIAKPIIAKVLAETKGKPEKDIRKALVEAYPFGERSMHPYKIWCDEIQQQRGIKTIKKAKQEEINGQQNLF